jgi:hypothetical protein
MPTRSRKAPWASLTGQREILGPKTTLGMVFPFLNRPYFAFVRSYTETFRESEQHGRSSLKFRHQRKDICFRAVLVR